MRDAFEKRERQSAVLATLILVLCRELHKTYNHHKNISATFPELMCAAAIRINDVRRRKPCSINAIARMAKLPRANTRRCLAKLIEQGAIERVSYGKEQGYISSKKFLKDRQNAAYFKRIMGAIIGSGKTLTKMNRAKGAGPK